jgi:hypothetical protein
LPDSRLPKLSEEPTPTEPSASKAPVAGGARQAA